MPGVDKGCTTHHLSACDCYTEKIIAVCEERLHLNPNCNCTLCQKARDIIKTLNYFKKNEINNTKK